MVVTRVFDRSATPQATITQPLLTFAPASAPKSASTSDGHPTEVPPSRVLTSELANGGGGRLAARRGEIEPLTADIRRVHFNVGTQVVKKLEAAREGRSHSTRHATMEQVLEAALDLLLERQAKARGQVKKPRTTIAMAPRLENPTLTEGQQIQSANRSVARPEGRAIDTPFAEPRPSRREGPREPIPAAVRRAAWERDQGGCTWPLDGGGCCGSAHRLELDHIIPWAEWGPSTVESLRVACHGHNTLAARHAFGERQMSRCGGGYGGGGRAGSGLRRLGRV